MESFGDSNCHSMSDSFSLYERYMRSFNVVDNFDNNHDEISELSSNCDSSNSGGNIDLSTVIQSKIAKQNDNELSKPGCSPLHILNFNSDRNLDSEFVKIESPCISFATSSETSSGTNQCLNDKSNIADIPVISEESKSEGFKTVFITSTMENSNNAVDSVPMFRDVTESVFKLPMSELSFNGTILKHVQKLKPIVDPITALSSVSSVLNLNDEHGPNSEVNSNMCAENQGIDCVSDGEEKNTMDSVKIDKLATSSGSQYDEDTSKKEANADGSLKWNMDHSYSSLEASFDSGMRSPDMFSDEDEVEVSPQAEPFWNFLKDFEAYDKKKVKKIEETLQGVLPPPSVTTLKTDVTQMLKKYYCFLPAFNGEENLNIESNSMTPTKKVSFIKIPPQPGIMDDLQEIAGVETVKSLKSNLNNAPKSDVEANTSLNDKSIDLKMCTETEAVEMGWPDILKCKYYDVYYNVTSYSEKLEQLMQRYGERFIGAETDTSVNIYSGGLQSPSSASKRKALRLKMAQAKSPGRRLSHLARRRQAFCSAATINEKAQTSTAKMVLIDKNFFPHRKLINSAERKSPRTRRTPGKKTPLRKTPGKKTPGKTPKNKSGGSSRKKAMRRLLMDDTLSKTQPNLKRALFISPEHRKSEPAPSSSVPHQAMKSKRALFGSPVRQAETKSLDGSSSDQFLKRKRDTLDDTPETSRSKIAKSLSFGGDTINSSQPIMLNRRASEITSRNMAELDETHKKKLLWAVTEALRLHGWRMSSPGFREKASSLARLTRRLLALPQHAARLAAPKLSTSDTMFKLARQYVFAIIQGRTIEECFQDEQIKLTNESNKITGYISASAYQQIKAKQTPSTFTSQIKENFTSSTKQEQPRSGSKNILQDKMAQAKSPGRRLSHLARRRQAFCSAATINEKAQTSTAKMVLIDKNFFPHRKLINSAERKSPRTRRTPGKKTPLRKTPGKKTPGKTPKNKSGGSSRKKAMRRLLMDDTLSKTQPNLKRALFISPEHRKSEPAPSSSVPHQAMKSKRALFGSPVRQAETKSLDGSSSDQFLKRKRDTLDDTPETSRSKIAKSLSFGGDTINSSQPIMLNRRASEITSRNMAELDETHKKKLLWAVTEALRLHGWRMSSPGFREKASSLARLTRRLLALPQHAARLAAPKLSTSDTMFKLARQYVFAIIQGRTIEECFQDEQIKLTNESNKITGYISASAYQQIKAKQTPSTFTSQIKENFTSSTKQEQPRSGSKNILQDKLVNIDSNSNSSSGFSVDKAMYKSNSMPSFEEAAKMRARRQISFDNVDFPKR